MKVLLKVSYLAMAIFIITSILISIDNNFLTFIFTMQSNQTCELITFNKLLTAILGLTALLVLFTNKSKLFIISFFSLWMLSGRTIGSSTWPEQYIYTGWHFIQTKRVNICGNTTNCETLFLNETKYQKLKFWRIRVFNSEIDYVFYTGPFIWHNTDSHFQYYFTEVKNNF